MIFMLQSQPAYNLLQSIIGKLKISEGLFGAKPAIIFQKERKDNKRAPKAIAKNCPVAESNEQNKRKEELIGAYNKSGKGEAFINDYVNGLEEMMFMTHHKLRQPVANILGMAFLIEQYANSPETMQKIVDYMKQSALDLDTFTRELTTFISDLEQKGKTKE